MENKNVLCSQMGVTMSVSQKYLKDENGEIISPIVSTSSIYNSDGETLDEILLKKVSGYRDYSWKSSYTLNFKHGTCALVVVAWSQSNAMYYICSYNGSTLINRNLCVNTASSDKITVTYSGLDMKIDLSNTGIVTVFQLTK